MLIWLICQIDHFRYDRMFTCLFWLSHARLFSYALLLILTCLDVIYAYLTLTCLDVPCTYLSFLSHVLGALFSN